MHSYPRTVGEFLVSCRAVIVRCADCQHSRAVPPDVLEMAFGTEFDLYAGYAELVSQLRCDMCGERRRSVGFIDATLYRTPEVSVEQRVSREMERGAFERARAGVRRRG